MEHMASTASKRGGTDVAAAIDLNATQATQPVARRRAQADALCTALLFALVLLHPLGWADSPPDVDPINFRMALQS